MGHSTTRANATQRDLRLWPVSAHELDAASTRSARDLRLNSPGSRLTKVASYEARLFHAQPAAFNFLESPRDDCSPQKLLTDRNSTLQRRPASRLSAGGDYTDVAAECPGIERPRALSFNCAKRKPPPQREDRYLWSPRSSCVDQAKLLIPEAPEEGPTVAELSASMQSVMGVCESLMERIRSIEAQLVIAHKHILERISDTAPVAAKVVDLLQTNEKFIAVLGERVAEQVSNNMDSSVAGVNAEVIAKDVVNMAVPLLEACIAKTIAKYKQSTPAPPPLPSPLPPTRARSVLYRTGGMTLMDSLTYSEQSPSDLYNSIVFTPNLISPFTFHRAAVVPPNAADNNGNTQTPLLFDEKPNPRRHRLADEEPPNLFASTPATTTESSSCMLAESTVLSNLNLGASLNGPDNTPRPSEKRDRRHSAEDGATT